MLGIDDAWVWMAYMGCVLSTVLCVAYGALNWNRGQDEEPTKDDVDWALEEDKMGEDL